jgi:hypothetical protein
LVGKPKGKNPLGRTKRIREDIAMSLREVVWGGVDWIHPAQDRNQWLAVVNTVMNIGVPFLD